MKGVWVRSLIGELRSYMLCGQKNRNMKQKQYCNKFFAATAAANFLYPRQAKIQWKTTYRENLFPVYMIATSSLSFMGRRRVKMGNREAQLKVPPERAAAARDWP